MAASLGSLDDLDALCTAHEQAHAVPDCRAVLLREAVVGRGRQVDFALLERVELLPAIKKID